MEKVWLITGSGRGIGASIARAALDAGHKVVATGRHLGQLHAAFPDVSAEQIAFIELDVADEAQAATAIACAVQRFGRIDVLVNNAAYGLLGNFEELTTSDIDDQFATNVFGVMNMVRAALPVLRSQRAGHIINISSIAGALGFSGASVYCATKYAVEGLSAALAMEVEQFGIKVTIVEPGFFRTDFLNPSSVRYGAKVVADYAAGGTVRNAYERYNGVQPGDPARLGLAMVELAKMAHPPKQYLAGSDALAMVTQSLQARLDEIGAFSAMSRSTDYIS